VPLFRKKPDPMSLTMALVEAYASCNRNMIERARQELVPVATIDILQSLYRFGQLFNKARLSPEQLAVIEEELSATAAGPELTAAIQHVGRAILIERSQAAMTDAVNTYGTPLLNSTSNQLRQMALMLAAITGSVSRRLEVQFKWG
jgi:hypothetical protein